MRKIYLQFLFLITCIAFTNAQDIHYVHQHAAPVYLNPAMTGIINHGNIRLVTNARSQWSTITNGYNTVLASADMKATSMGNSILGVGLQILSDKAGDLDFGTTSATISTSVLMPLGNKKTFISAGFSNAYVNRSIDLSKLSGEELEPLIGSMKNNINYWDVNVGGSYFKTVDQFNFYYVGGSVSHVNKPSASFGTTESSVGEIDQKISVSLGGSFSLNRVVTVQPTITFMKQAASNQIIAGSFFKFTKTVLTKNRKIVKGQSSFYAGAWARYNSGIVSGLDAIVAAFRSDFGPFSVTFSFDVNVSGLAASTAGFGAPELSVSYIIDNKNINKRLSSIQCPSL